MLGSRTGVRDGRKANLGTQNDSLSNREGAGYLVACRESRSRGQSQGLGKPGVQCVWSSRASKEVGSWVGVELDPPSAFTVIGSCEKLRSKEEALMTTTTQDTATLGHRS